MQCMHGTTWSHHTLNQRHQIQFYGTTISMCEGALIQGWARLLISIFGRKIVSSVQRAFLLSVFEPFRYTSIYRFRSGDHADYTQARTNKSRSRVSKHRNIAFARWWPITVISLMWTDGDNSLVDITPKSLQDLTCGSRPIFPRIWYETDTALVLVFKILHLSDLAKY